MADPFSIATGAFGVASLAFTLFSGCVKGFVLLSNARNLPKDGATIVCMLNVQEVQLVEWAKRAGLLNQQSLDRRLNVLAIEGILGELRGLLNDTDKLKARYGLEFELKEEDNQQPTLGTSASWADTASLVDLPRALYETRNRILATGSKGDSVQPTILQRLRWTTVDKTKIEKLVADIQKFIRELWYLIDPWRLDVIATTTENIASSLVTLNNRFDQLTILNTAFESLQRNSDELKPLRVTPALSAEFKAVRIVLEGEHEQDATQAMTEPQGPVLKRQNIIQKLERCSSSRMGPLTTMKKRRDLGIASYDQTSVFVECKVIDPMTASKILPRIENLAALLASPKAQTFRSFQCRGILEEGNRVSLIFHYPHASPPRSLLELFDARDGLDVPSLSIRIQLARQVVRIIRDFHRIGWLHKAIRSENILFVNEDPSSEKPDDSILANPILAGFSFARLDSPSEISERPSYDAARDIYRHPKALGGVPKTFDASMDLYSLGTVLLEIAEWRSLKWIVREIVNIGTDQHVPLTELAKIHDSLISGQGRVAPHRLQQRMGDRYTAACQLCLRGMAAAKEMNLSHQIEDSEGGSLIDLILEQLDGCVI